MSDSVPPVTPDPPPTGRVASAAREVTGFARFVAGLSPASVQQISIVTMTVFMITLTGWVVWKSQTTQTDRENQLARYADTRDEVTRSHCDSREEKLRVWFAQERDKDRAYHKGQEDSWQRVHGQMVDEWRKWRELVTPILRKMGIMGEFLLIPGPH